MLKLFSLLAALTFFLCGCVVVTKEYYLPIDSSLANEERSCGSVPSGGFYSSLVEGVALSISAAPNNGDLRIHFQYILGNANSTFQLAEKNIQINSPNHPLILIDVTATNSELPSLDPTIKMTGEEQFEVKVSNFKVPSFSPKSFTLTLPPLLVNGNRISLPPVNFTHVRKKGVMTCIQ